ncbi:MAG: M20/M25/M40 family metallo-hydrolase [Thermoprotei archaeon]|nr:M20/M25/M40 family metallo-hydrolase [Thermoprotei archaeon]
MSMKIIKYIEENFNEYLEGTRRFLMQPSISGSEEGIIECADMLKEISEELGVKVTLLRYGGHPIVYGKLKGNSKGKPLICYGMYDVQPPEPLEAWIAPPFETRIVDGKLIARGAINTKGPLMAFIYGVKSVLEIEGEVPVDIIFAIEGEEEIGSPSIPKFVEDKKDELSNAGLTYFHTMSENAKGVPAIRLGNKGIVFMELSIKNSDYDVHSSLAQGIVSPVARLVHALSTMVGVNGEILLKELYEDVRVPSEKDIKYMEDIMEYFDMAELIKLYNIRRLRYEGEELYKVIFFQPSINIDGISAGYMGLGTKTILPAEARIDIRLVPDMESDKVVDVIKAHLKTHGFEDIEVKVLDKYEWSKTDPDNPAVKVAVEAHRELGYDPKVIPMMSGSAPFYAFSRKLKLPVIATGLGYGARAHAPNEFITVDGLKRSIKYAAVFLLKYSRT